MKNHSMLYFFHHYELPAILQQAHLQQILLRNHAPTAAQSPTPSTAATTLGPSATSTPPDSPGPLTPATDQTQQNYISELSQLDSDSNDSQQNVQLETSNPTDESSMTTQLSTAPTTIAEAIEPITDALTSVENLQGSDFVASSTSSTDDMVNNSKIINSNSTEHSTCEEFEVIDVLSSSSKENSPQTESAPDS